MASPGKKYNPITHLGEVGAPSTARATGVKLADASATAGHLAGAACVPKSTPRGAAPPRPAAATAAPLRAKVDHLHGTACSLGPEAPHSPGSATGRVTPGGEAVNLRASVDHLAGGACAVRDVVAQATREVEAPSVSRGIITQHVKGKQAAREMHEGMWGSMVF